MARAQIVVELIDSAISKIAHKKPRGEPWLSFVHGDSFPFADIKYTSSDYCLICLHFASA